VFHTKLISVLNGIIYLRGEVNKFLAALSFLIVFFFLFPDYFDGLSVAAVVISMSHIVAKIIHEWKEIPSFQPYSAPLSRIFLP
jgi:hypothetical protein